jgi:hypothetical protein
MKFFKQDEKGNVSRYYLPGEDNGDWMARWNSTGRDTGMPESVGGDPTEEEYIPAIYSIVSDLDEEMEKNDEGRTKFRYSDIYGYVDAIHYLAEFNGQDRFQLAKELRRHIDHMRLDPSIGSVSSGGCRVQRDSEKGSTGEWWKLSVFVIPQIAVQALQKRANRSFELPKGADAMLKPIEQIKIRKGFPFPMDPDEDESEEGMLQ